MASDNCAVGPDGNLLNASQIVWYDDPDDDEPMAPAATSSTAQRQISTSTLDSFVTKGPSATRRSTRAPRPSTKAIDPNNVMALKRKPSNSAAGKRSSRPRHASPDHEEDGLDEATEPELIESEDDDPDDPVTAYEETKALADADREVSVHCCSFVPLTHLILAKAMQTKSKAKRTADLSTIFMRATDYIHPDRGKAEGHFCLVCKFVFFLNSNAVHNILPRNKGVRQVACFFSGGTSTLRTHIAR
jgi:hypothetical protein